MKESRLKTIGECQLYQGDCFDILPKVASEADAVISDPPYGITMCDWDTVFSFDNFWDIVENKTKQSANYVLFGCGKFTVDLINSKYRWFRYDMIWEKDKATNFMNVNLQPLRKHEQILVFGRPGFAKKTTYNPQKTPGGRTGVRNNRGILSSIYGNIKGSDSVSDGTRYPCSVLHFNKERSKTFIPTPSEHPTQKPLALMEWLVKTYTNEGDTVIDPFMGSGTTGMACAMHNRRFIGIEREKHYYETAVKRIEAAYQ